MAPEPTESAKIEEARKLGKTDPLKAEAIYKEILSKKPGASEAALREYESALMGLGESYRDTRKTDELAELVRSSTSSLSSFTKAKTAKLGIGFRLCRSVAVLRVDSAPTTRSLLLYSEHYRRSNIRH